MKNNKETISKICLSLMCVMMCACVSCAEILPVSGYDEIYLLDSGWIDGNRDAFYLSYWNNSAILSVGQNETLAPTIQIYYAVSSIRYAIFIEYNETISRIQINKTLLTGDMFTENLLCKFQGTTAEIVMNKTVWGIPIFGIGINNQSLITLDPLGLLIPPKPITTTSTTSSSTTTTSTPSYPTAGPTYEFAYWDEVYLDKNGTRILFANDEKEYCFFVNGTRAISSINVDTYYNFTETFEGGDHYAIVSANRMNFEMKFYRGLEFCTDNKFKFTVTYETGKVQVYSFSVRPRTKSGAFEVTADMKVFFNNLISIFFGGWYSGIIWACMIISLWRIAQRPWFLVSKNTTDRQAVMIGKIVSCEKSTRLPGMYRYLFKSGTKISEWFCKENYDTLRTQVSFSRFMVYFEFYPDLVPVELPIPDELQWKKNKVRKCAHNYFIYFLKIITTCIPSTHLAVFLDKKLLRDDLTDNVVSVNYFVIDFMEDRFTHVVDAQYEECVLDSSAKKLVWEQINREGLNNSQIEDLKRKLVPDITNPEKQSTIRKLLLTNERNILEKFATLRDGIQDRASRIQIKVLFDSKMMRMEKKLEDITKLYTDTEDVYKKFQLNYALDLQKALKEARNQLDFNKQSLPKIIGEVMGQTQLGVPFQRAVGDALAKQMTTFQEQQNAIFETQLKTKEKTIEQQNKRISFLEEKITQKHATDITVKDISVLSGEGQDGEKQNAV